MNPIIRVTATDLELGDSDTVGGGVGPMSNPGVQQPDADAPSLAGLCRFPTCGEPIILYPQSTTPEWDHLLDPSGDVTPHTPTPAPGSVAYADVWDCDEAAAGRLETLAEVREPAGSVTRG